MIPALSDRFLASVRREFQPLFAQYGFREMRHEADLNGAILAAANSSHYLRISCDYRDSYIQVAFGQLSEGLVPPVPIAPSTQPSEVREIPGPIIEWLTTGNKAHAFSI